LKKRITPCVLICPYLSINDLYCLASLVEIDHSHSKLNTFIVMIIREVDMQVWMVAIAKKYTSYEELKIRRVVAQGWPDLGDLSLLVAANNVREQIIESGEDGDTARIFENLLSNIQQCDLALGFEGTKLRGICQLTRVTRYAYDDVGQASGIPPSTFSKPSYNYANILFPVLWIDWEDFVQFMRGAPTPSAGGQGPRGIDKSHHPQDVIDAWNRFCCCRKNNDQLG
jgi:hypothetical protein